MEDITLLMMNLDVMILDIRNKLVYIFFIEILSRKKYHHDYRKDGGADYCIRYNCAVCLISIQRKNKSKKNTYKQSKKSQHDFSLTSPRFF